MATENQIRIFAKYKIREAIYRFASVSTVNISDSLITSCQNLIDTFDISTWDTDQYPEVSLAIQALSISGFNASYEDTGIIRVSI